MSGLSSAPKGARWRPGERHLEAIVAERIGVEAVDPVAQRADLNTDIVVDPARHVGKGALAAPRRMHAVEVEREGIEELQRLVVGEEPLFLNPGCGIGIVLQHGGETLLALALGAQHGVGCEAVLLRHDVDQHLVREPVASVVEAPNVHAVQQPAIGVVRLIVLGRAAAGQRDDGDRRLHQVVRQPGPGVERRVVVQVLPALVVPTAGIEEVVARLGPSEGVVAEILGELARQLKMLVEGDGETAAVLPLFSLALDDHGVPPAFPSTASAVKPGQP